MGVEVEVEEEVEARRARARGLESSERMAREGKGEDGRGRGRNCPGEWRGCEVRGLVPRLPGAMEPRSAHALTPAGRPRGAGYS